MPGFPDGARSLHRSLAHDAATAYVVVDPHRLDDKRPYLWKTDDFGKTWKRLSASCPRMNTCTRCARTPSPGCSTSAPSAASVLDDDGATWAELKLNLPTVAVHDLAVKDDDLVVGTNGRSIWIFDHLAVCGR